MPFRPNNSALDKPVVGGDGLAADPVFFDVGKDAVNGYMTTDYYSPNAKEQTPSGEAFIKAWEAKFNSPTHTGRDGSRRLQRDRQRHEPV